VIPLDRVVRRNTLVLSTTMALNWIVIVLLASLTTPAIGVLFGMPGLAGVGFGIFLILYAFGGLLTGRLMDAWGRRPGLQLAFLVGAVGAVLIYIGLGQQSLGLSFVGLLVIGIGTGGANLARAAGADMYPPERRPRGIALVLVGAAFGAIGAPIVFAPLLAGAGAGEATALALPFLVAAVILLAGAMLLLAIRVDPREIAEQLRAAGAPAGSVAAPPRPISQLIGLPLVPLALLSAIAAQAVMTAIMALAGLVLVHHGHDAGSVLMTVSVHFLGMFGLVLVVGRLVEVVGRFRSVLIGLLILAGGALLLLPGPQLINFVPGMFAVGVGWNIAFVASTAILADAAQANERGRLLGLSDFVALLGAAMLSVVSGLVLDALGLSALIVVGVVLALGPVALFIVYRVRLQSLEPS
jgi:MFS family permease